VTVSCEHGNEPLDFIKGGQFLDQLSEYKLIKKESAPCNQLKDNILFISYVCKQEPIQFLQY